MKKKIFSVIGIILISGMVLSAGDAGPEIVIKPGESFWYAYMEFGGSFDNMEKAVGKFMGVFFQQGLKPGGPLMGIYYNDPNTVKPEELKWNLGFPIGKDTNVKEPVKKKEFVHETVAVYLYTGPYENMDKAFEKILAFLEKKGYKMTFPTYDKFLNTPMEVKPEELKTEIIVPVVKK